MSALESVAVNLQNWRQRRGMSVSALARTAGVSKSTVSELERHNGNPSLDTLWALARALDIPLGFLFSEHDGANALRVVREDDASVVKLEEPGYVARLMTAVDVSGELEVYVISMADGVRRDSDSHGFGVIEHAIAVEGRVDVGAGGDSAELGPGDLISFPADQPHHYAALAGPARVVAIHQYPSRHAQPDAPVPAELERVARG
jgi:XRE family transcriptional regulator, regulator of sulfur utilization